MEIDNSHLKNALNTLESSIAILEDNKHEIFADMLEDACIKRFEYTLEISRKLMKRILKKIYGKTEEELTVNNVFRYMQGYGLIRDWEIWRMYYEKRNNTAHEYNLSKSRELVNLIPEFLKDTKFFINKMDEMQL
ncbi:nucleotidyltransferase substrate binding protein [bacterium]|nr:nucleotidyltransferase substrate binding protein [bacterium]